jgi:hypothetical protein
MHPEGNPKGPLFARSVVVLVVLAGLLAGCGGGGDQSGNESQGGSEQQEKKAGAAKKGAPEVKIAIGRVISVKPDRSVIAVRTVQGEQGGERMIFKLRKKNSQVQLDGKKAELSAAKEGQQAQIEYVVRNERNRARVVQLFAAGGGEGTG